MEGGVGGEGEVGEIVGEGVGLVVVGIGVDDVGVRESEGVVGGDGVLEEVVVGVGGGDWVGEGVEKKVVVV